MEEERGKMATYALKRGSDWQLTPYWHGVPVLCTVISVGTPVQFGLLHRRVTVLGTAQQAHTSASSTAVCRRPGEKVRCEGISPRVWWI
jgi:hypothetical protein